MFLIKLLVCLISSENSTRNCVNHCVPNHMLVYTVKPVISSHSNRSKNLVWEANYCLMQVKSIAECSKGGAFCNTLTFIKQPFVIKIFVLSIFEWPLKTGFTVGGILS